MVCDGVGGHRGGARAAQLALDAVVAALARSDDDGDVARWLIGAAETANAAVVAGREADPTVADMATTLVVAARDPAGGTAERERWVVLQVGDSPAWHVAPATGRSVTWDHSLVGDLVRAGVLSPDDARGHPSRHIVTRAVGIASTVEPEVFALDLAPEDHLVLASDGLSDVLAPEEVPQLAAVRDGRGLAHVLVDAALRRGTRDNVTVVVVGRPEPTVPG